MTQYEPIDNSEITHLDHNNTSDHPPIGPTQRNGSPHQSLLKTEASHLNPASSAKDPYCPRQSFTLWEKIGAVGLVTLMLGTLVILASCGVLIFVWHGAELAKDRQEPESWKNMVASGWTSRVVTICSAAIRTAIATHIGLIGAALSAIILETSGVNFSDIPVLSSERASKSGLVNVLPAVLRQSTRSFWGTLHSSIIVMGIVVIVVSTFTSTILLTDFATIRIAGPTTIQSQAITSKSYGTFWDSYNGPSYWRSKPSAQWRFAESQANTSRYGDTGNTYRAMLPFSDVNSRTSLEFYSGPAMVTNTRTICHAPQLDNSSVVMSDIAIARTLNSGMQGVDVVSQPNLLVWSSRQWSTGECQLYWGDKEEGSGWPLSLCFNIEPLRPTFKNLPVSPDPDTDENFEFRQVLILNSTRRISPVKSRRNITLPYVLVEHFTSEISIPKRLQNLTFKTGDTWTKVYDEDGYEVLSATACHLNGYSPQIYNVTMSGREILSEPDLDPRGISDTRLQMDSKYHSQDYANRGILKLDLGSRLNITSKDESFGVFFSELPTGSESGWGMSPGTDRLSQSWSPHSAHYSVFQSIIQEHGDPAQALQALATRLYQMGYYDQLENHDLKFPVTTVHSVGRLIPSRWTGLVVVLALIAVHLGLVFTTMALFVLKTTGSALGNAWHTYAQTARTTNAVDSADMMLDSEVRNWAKVTGRNTDVYALSRSGEDGKAEVRLLNRNKEDSDSNMP